MRHVLVLVLSVLLGTMAIASGCKGGGNDAQAIEDAVLAAALAYADGDEEAFRDAFTDQGLADLFEFDVESLDGFLEFLPDLIGEDPPVITSFAGTEVDGDSGSTDATTEQSGIVVVDRFRLSKDGEDWIIDGVDHSVSTPDLDGYSTTSLGMDEFSFELDSGEISPGNVAFELENSGEQAHEALLLSLEDDVDLDDAVMSIEQPEGVEIIADVEVDAGESGEMVLSEELEAGRYAFVCFLPDEDDSEGTPHAFLGQTIDFRIE